ncbi:MAG: hypothetical protein SV686_11785, partial [Thermodesulfobacteriota bacterium]|nr:hypothetical protein [Thermodesulfobacteriota bacterium]
MGKNIIASGFFLVIVLFCTSSFAQPSIESRSDSWVHKGTATINGTGFGVKEPAAPLMWDDGEDKTTETPASVIASGYCNVEPLAPIPGSHQIMYRNAPFTAVSVPVEAPHGRSTKFIGGGHYENYEGLHAQGVSLTVSTPTDGDMRNRWFTNWYYRLDPSWPSCGEGMNHKWIVFQSGVMPYSNSPYTNEYFYIDFSNHPCHKDSWVGVKSMGNLATGWCELWYQNPTACPPGSPIGSGTIWRGDNPALGWVKMETQLSNDLGFLEVLMNNHSVWKGEGRPGWVEELTAVASGIRSVTIGGFYRYRYNPEGGSFQHSDAFRYFDDIYIDCTLARVMLGDDEDYDSCTILEPQIPTAWNSNGNSITCTVNLGKLPDSGTAYLFVFDADNNRNPVGYPVTLGGGCECGSPPYTSGHSPAKDSRGFVKDAPIIVRIQKGSEDILRSS